MIKKKISVIIRCKNEERWIGYTIQSILDNIKSPEIIVVDNNSNDNSLNIVKSFVHDPKLTVNEKYTKIKIINIKDYSPGKAINKGVRAASGDIVIIISAHCVLKKINLKKTISDLEKFICIFGNQIPIWNGNKIKKRYIWSHFTDQVVVNMYSELEKRFFFHNAISVFKKKDLVKYPFDEYLVGKEDRYWVNHHIKNKKKSLYDPSIEVEHHYTTEGNTWRGLA
jgi:glycosyltransferase involved in cell wall biosynthesis